MGILTRRHGDHGVYTEKFDYSGKELHEHQLIVTLVVDQLIDQLLSHQDAEAANAQTFFFSDGTVVERIINGIVYRGVFQSFGGATTYSVARIARMLTKSEPEQVNENGKARSQSNREMMSLARLRSAFKEDQNGSVGRVDLPALRISMSDGGSYERASHP